jgi:small multidrug resistance pump
VDYLYLAIAIVAEVGATSALKASDALTRPTFSAIVLIGYVMAYYFLSLALRTLPLAIAYATWACAGTILMALMSLMVFRQSLDRAGVPGISIMLIGTIILNGFSRLSPH